MAAIEAPVILAIIYGLVSLVGSAMKKRGQVGTTGAPVPMPRQQKRAETMDDLLAEMREQLERASRGPEPEARPAWSDPEPEEEFTSLETEPTVVSIEVPRPQVERVKRDYDGEAARLIQRRIDAADARNGEWTPADHRAFDKRIRAAAPAPATPAITTPDPARLREAMVWREILGPPLGWPDRDSR